MNFPRLPATHPLAAIAGLALIALTIPTYRLLDAERQNVGAIPRAIDKQGDDTRAFLAAQALAIRADLARELGEFRTTADTLVAHESAAWRREAGTHIVGITDVLDRRLGSIQADANAHGVAVEQLAAHELGRAGDQVERIGNEVQATLAETRRTVHDLHPQLLGVAGAAKVSLGEVAQTMRVVRDETPKVIATVEKIGDNSDRTTAASARIAENFAAASKPLPKWLRIVLAIAPPVASTGASAAAAGAALGAFR